MLVWFCVRVSLELAAARSLPATVMLLTPQPAMGFDRIERRHVPRRRGVGQAVLSTEARTFDREPLQLLRIHVFGVEDVAERPARSVALADVLVRRLRVLVAERERSRPRLGREQHRPARPVDVNLVMLSDRRHVVQSVADAQLLAVAR